MSGLLPSAGISSGRHECPASVINWAIIPSLSRNFLNYLQKYRKRLKLDQFILKVSKMKCSVFFHSFPTTTFHKVVQSSVKDSIPYLHWVHNLSSNHLLNVIVFSSINPFFKFHVYYHYIHPFLFPLPIPSIILKKQIWLCNSFQMVSLWRGQGFKAIPCLIFPWPNFVMFFLYSMNYQVLHTYLHLCR